MGVVTERKGAERGTPLSFLLAHCCCCPSSVPPSVVLRERPPPEEEEGGEASPPLSVRSQSPVQSSFRLPSLSPFPESVCEGVLSNKPASFHLPFLRPCYYCLRGKKKYRQGGGDIFSPLSLPKQGVCARKRKRLRYFPFLSEIIIYKPSFLRLCRYIACVSVSCV